MRRIAVLASFVLVCSSLFWAQGNLAPLNVKLGLWETTRDTTIGGMAPIPPEALAKMTPEQRAKMDQAIGPGSGQLKTNVRKTCITAEKMQKVPFGDERKDCTYTVSSGSATKREVHFSCTQENGKMKVNGVFHVEALSSESVKGSMEIATEGGDRKMTMNSTFSSKWLGPSCGDVQ